MIGETETGCSSKSGLGRLEEFIAAWCGKGDQEGISISDKFVGNSWSYTGKPEQGEAAWDENRVPLAPVLGGETRMDSLI